MQNLPNQGFWCDICRKSYSSTSNLNKHIRTQHNRVRFICSFCGKEYRSKGQCQNHERSVHGGIASLPPVLPNAYHQLPVVQRLESALPPAPEHRTKGA